MPSYRGRLLFPVIARIYRLDPSGTAFDPDGDPTTRDGGYDDDFREPIRVDDGTQNGSNGRVELDPVDVPVQVEDEEWENQAIGPTGDDPTSTLRLVFHFTDLERLGFVDPTTGDALLPRKGDRLDSLRNPKTGLIQAVTGNGMYCIQAQPRSYGLLGQRNLLVATFVERGKAPES